MSLLGIPMLHRRENPPPQLGSLELQRHAAGFTPGVLTFCSRAMVRIPRDKLGGILSTTWVVIARRQISPRRLRSHAKVLQTQFVVHLSATA